MSIFGFLKKLFRRKPVRGWFVVYEPQGDKPRIIAEVTADNPEDAMDAAQEAVVNYQWKTGAFVGGQFAFGNYGIVPKEKTAEEIAKEKTDR